MFATLVLALLLATISVGQSDQMQHCELLGQLAREEFPDGVEWPLVSAEHLSSLKANQLLIRILQRYMAELQPEGKPDLRHLQTMLNVRKVRSMNPLLNLLRHIEECVRLTEGMRFRRKKSRTHHHPHTTSTIDPLSREFLDFSDSSPALSNLPPTKTLQT